MFYLVGLGLFDEKDISLKGLECLKNVDKIYAEFIFNGEIQFSCTGNSKRGISIPIRKWENLAKKAKNSIITIFVCTKEKDEDFWKEYLPFA